MRPTREEAWKLLNEYNKSDALLKHGLAVEGVMRHFAEINGEDTEKWGVIGLLHDLDYEMYPEKHCVKRRNNERKLTLTRTIFTQYVRMAGDYAVMLNRLKKWKKCFIQ